MVVPVLITNCQVSLYLKNGPRTAHTNTTRTAITNAGEVPAHVAVDVAKRTNQWVDRVAEPVSDDTGRLPRMHPFSRGAIVL